MGQSKSSVISSEAENCPSYTATADTSKSRLPFKPFFKRGKSNSTSTFGCKVILAKKNGKSFSELNQTYISVNEDSANVAYITGKVQEKWGKVVLVAGNGLPIQGEEVNQITVNQHSVVYFALSTCKESVWQTICLRI